MPHPHRHPRHQCIPHLPSTRSPNSSSLTRYKHRARPKRLDPLYVHPPYLHLARKDIFHARIGVGARRDGFGFGLRLEFGRSGLGLGGNGECLGLGFRGCDRCVGECFSFGL